MFTASLIFPRAHLMVMQNMIQSEELEKVHLTD
jgi:hypothetical protein